MRHTSDLRQLGALLRAYFRMSLRGKAVRTFYRRRPSKLGGALALVLLYAAMGAVAGFGASARWSGLGHGLPSVPRCMNTMTVSAEPTAFSAARTACTGSKLSSSQKLS